MENTKSVLQNQSLLKSIKSAIPKHCSNCGFKYKDRNLTLIQSDDYAAIFHLTCENCQESYLINVVSPLGVLQGSSRIPVKVDITSAKEAKQFIGTRSVSSDDVLNAYGALKRISSAKELSELLKESKAK